MLFRVESAGLRADTARASASAMQRPDAFGSSVVMAIGVKRETPGFLRLRIVSLADDAGQLQFEATWSRRIAGCGKAQEYPSA